MLKPSGLRVVNKATVNITVMGEDLEHTTPDTPGVLVTVSSLSNLAVGQKCHDLALVGPRIEDEVKMPARGQKSSQPPGADDPLEGAKSPREERDDSG